MTKNPYCVVKLKKAELAAPKTGAFRERGEKNLARDGIAIGSMGAFLLEFIAGPSASGAPDVASSIERPTQGLLDSI